MTRINDHLAKLGFRCRDSVTGLEGIITSISFDLFGCIQAIVHPGLDKDGKPKECHWFDVSRLVLLTKQPVMRQPDFIDGAIADGSHGPAEKPKGR